MAAGGLVLAAVGALGARLSAGAAAGAGVGLGSSSNSSRRRQMGMQHRLLMLLLLPPLRLVSRAAAGCGRAAAACQLL